MKEYLKDEKCTIEVRQKLNRFNLERVDMTAFCVVLLQVYNLTVRKVQKDSALLMWGAIFLLVSSLCFMLYEVIVKKRRTAVNENIHCMAFWVILCIGMIPFIARDSELSAIPINMVLLFGVITVTPVFTVKEQFIVTSVFSAACIAAAFLANETAMYWKYTVCIIVVGFLLGYCVSQSYIKLISGLLHDTITDSHTRLLNRRGGYELLENTIALCKRHGDYCAVLLMDIDDFKQFNDTYGHICGDDALKIVANELERCFKRKADVIFRYGGEEFIVAVSVSAPKYAEALAATLLHSISSLSLKVSESKNESLTASIGVAIMEPTEIYVTAEELIKRADIQMYKAKKDGKNSYSVEEKK